MIILNNKTISVKDGGFYSYVVTTPKQEEKSSKPKPFEQSKTAGNSGALYLPTSAYEQAKKVAPNLDIYFLEHEWRVWMADKPKPDNPAGSFVGFCRAKYQKKTNNCVVL